MRALSLVVLLLVPATAGSVGVGGYELFLSEEEFDLFIGSVPPQQAREGARHPTGWGSGGWGFVRNYYVAQAPLRFDFDLTVESSGVSLAAFPALLPFSVVKDETRVPWTQIEERGDEQELAFALSLSGTLMPGETLDLFSVFTNDEYWSLAGAGELAYSYSSEGSLRFSALPEPSSALLGAVALIAVALRVRARR